MRLPSSRISEGDAFRRHRNGHPFPGLLARFRRMPELRTRAKEQRRLPRPLRHPTPGNATRPKTGRKSIENWMPTLRRVQELV